MSGRHVHQQGCTVVVRVRVADGRSDAAALPVLRSERASDAYLTPLHTLIILDAKFFCKEPRTGRRLW